jgi:hypothetical protein
LVIIGIVVATISIVLTVSFIIPHIQKMDPNYVQNKITKLEQMPCNRMSSMHIHEIDDDGYYQAYDKKYVECFGHIP